MKLLLIIFFLTACSSIEPTATISNRGDAKKRPASVLKKGQQRFATLEEVQKFSREVSDVYLIGPGDILSLSVWKRSRISNPRIAVAANGKINILRIGFVEVQGRTVVDLQTEITERLKKFYKNPEVTLNIVESRNNRVFVLGRVANPGEIQLPVIGSDLMKVLAMAGGLPVLDKHKAPLTECIITRGNKRLRINLRELLNKGNMNLNARIQNNDVIFISESGRSQNVYLLGEIRKPGAMNLVDGMTFLDALMIAGGPLKSAQPEKTFLIRLGEERFVKKVNLKTMLENAEADNNHLLEGGDVIFVARSGLNKFQEFLTYLTQGLKVLDLTTSISERAGLMQQLRQIWWGQDGFVND